MGATVATVVLIPAGASAEPGITSQLSVGPAGGNAALPSEFEGSSADGGRVFFTTYEPLVAEDTDSNKDVYERAGSTTTLLSVGPAAGNGDFDVSYEGASEDGTKVWFITDEPLLLSDADERPDVYERDGSTLTHLSLSASGGNGDVSAFHEGASADGSSVYIDTAEQLAAEDTDAQADLYRSSGGVVSLVSIGPDGGNSAGFSPGFAAASADGARVVFSTAESLVAADADTAADLYERSGTTTTLLSGGTADTPALFRGASTDAANVFFMSQEQLLPEDTDSGFDVYGSVGGTLTRVSQSATAGNTAAMPASFLGSSADGSRVFFGSNESMTNEDADGGATDVYERSGGATTLISRAPTPGADDAEPATLDYVTPDGASVYFSTRLQLAGGDTDSQIDAYVRRAGQVSLLSTGPAGANGPGDAYTQFASADGSRVVIDTEASLVGSDADGGLTDLYERAAGATTLLSTGPTAPAGSTGAAEAIYGGASADAQRVFFSSEERLVAGDPLGEPQSVLQSNRTDECPVHLAREERWRYVAPQ